MLPPLAALSFGVRFRPTAQEAIGLYLRRWIAGDPVPDADGIIHAADVYKHPPADLAAAFPRLPKTHDRYFYATCHRAPIRGGAGYRVSRAVAGVSWGTNGNKLVVDAVTGEHIGFVETLKYGKTDWLMEEFHRLPEDAAGDGVAERVLCRLYVKEHPKPGSIAVAQSLAGDRLLLQQPAAMAAGQQRMPPSSPRNRRVMALPVLPPVPVPAPVTIQRKRAAPAPVADAPQPKKRTRAAPAPATRPVMASPPAATAPPVPKVVPLRQVPRPSWCPPPPPGLLGLEPRRPAPTVVAAAEPSPASTAAEIMALLEEYSAVQEEEAPAAAQEEDQDDADVAEIMALLESVIEEKDSAVQEEEAPAAAQEEEEDEWACLDAELFKEDAIQEQSPTAAAVAQEEDQVPAAAAAARSGSLEGLAADERGDDDIALDISDVLDLVGDEDDGDGAWQRMSLSDYNFDDLQY